MWTFVQNDSADVASIVTAAPILKNGIDVIYIDSLHTSEHVYKEIFGWFPYLKKGGIAYFDDVDTGPIKWDKEKTVWQRRSPTEISTTLLKRYFGPIWIRLA